MLLGLRAPTELPLAFEKGFQDQMSAVPDRAREISHPATVEIVENHDEIERTLGNRVMLEIRLYPLDRQPAVLRRAAPGANSGAIGVHRRDARPELGRGNGMTSPPTGQVQHPRP